MTARYCSHLRAAHRTSSQQKQLLSHAARELLIGLYLVDRAGSNGDLCFSDLKYTGLVMPCDQKPSDFLAATAIPLQTRDTALHFLGTIQQAHGILAFVTIHKRVG